MLIALVSWAYAAPPTHLTVTYTVKYDLPPAADQVCGVTQVCDCAVTWSGGGTLVTADPPTYKGTWKLTSGACNDAFLLWTPANGVAYHTIRLSPDGQRVVEWIAHASPSDTTRATTDIKAHGQVWVAEMQAAIDPATHVAEHYERDQGMVGPFQLTTEHHLTLRLDP